MTDIQEIVDVIDRLLGPGGCPWDKEQTPVSLCDYLIEECFELVEAIRDHNQDEVREELSDVLFLLLFISKLYEQQGQLEFKQAVQENAAKMIRRHPHVFSETEINSQQELFANWEKIKREEKKDKKDQSVFSSLPRSLPPLLRAYRINAKAARIGFTWKTNQDQEQNLQREWEEWLEVKDEGDEQRRAEEFGDYLFSLVETGRRKGIKANAALHSANSKFLDRFAAMEKLAKERNLDIHALDLEAMDKLWDEVKISSKA